MDNIEVVCSRAVFMKLKLIIIINEVTNINRISVVGNAQLLVQFSYQTWGGQFYFFRSIIMSRIERYVEQILHANFFASVIKTYFLIMYNVLAPL